MANVITKILMTCFKTIIIMLCRPAAIPPIFPLLTLALPQLTGNCTRQPGPRGHQRHDHSSAAHGRQLGPDNHCLRANRDQQKTGGCSGSDQGDSRGDAVRGGGHALPSTPSPATTAVLTVTASARSTRVQPAPTRQPATATMRSRPTPLAARRRTRGGTCSTPDGGGWLMS